MTDPIVQPTEPTPVTAPPPGPEAAPPPPPLTPAAPAQPTADLSDRMKAFGEEVGARGQQLGRDAQAAGERWARDPGVVRAANTASQLWGVLLLLVGLYFFVQVTLGYALPEIPWSVLWPAFLVFLGIVVLTRGMARRS